MAGRFDRTVGLSDGTFMPRIGLGCMSSDLEVSEEKAAEIVEAMKSAIDAGYRLFDTAATYQTEVALGQAIRAKIEDGTIRREDVYITTKLWNTNHRPERVPPALRQSLKNLDMDYLDLYLIHTPVSFMHSKGMVPTDSDGNILFDNDVDLMDTWKAMEACQKAGLTKSIGLSNFTISQVQRVLDICEVRPVVNQVECHPFNTKEKLVNSCQKNNVAVMCYTPIGGQPMEDFDVLQLGKKDGHLSITQDKILQSIGAKYNKSAAQVALRFQLQRGLVVIPKSFNPERQKQNIDVFDFNISEDDMKTIFQMNRNHQIMARAAIPMCLGSKENPFTDSELAS